MRKLLFIVLAFTACLLFPEGGDGACIRQRPLRPSRRAICTPTSGRLYVQFGSEPSTRVLREAESCPVQPSFRYRRPAVPAERAVVRGAASWGCTGKLTAAFRTSDLSAGPHAVDYYVYRSAAAHYLAYGISRTVRRSVCLKYERLIMKEIWIRLKFARRCTPCPGNDGKTPPPPGSRCPPRCLSPAWRYGSESRLRSLDVTNNLARRRCSSAGLWSSQGMITARGPDVRFGRSASTGGALFPALRGALFRPRHPSRDVVQPVSDGMRSVCWQCPMRRFRRSPGGHVPHPTTASPPCRPSSMRIWNTGR